MSGESIFISYVRKDGAAAKKIVVGLRKAGFTILAVKSSTTDPVELKKELSQKISRADCVFALISPNAMKTKRWQSEVRFATRREKLIVPVLIEGDEMPPEFEDDVYPLEDIDDELADLVGYVKDLFDEDDGYDDAADDDPFAVLEADDDDGGSSRRVGRAGRWAEQLCAGVGSADFGGCGQRHGCDIPDGSKRSDGSQQLDHPRSR